jgi:Asp-tRNA(Asn)/Glu-tRNA(Gln) amidotransferase A subunit family amidase
MGATVSDLALLDSVVMNYDFKKEYQFDVKHTYVRPNLSSVTVGVPTGWINEISPLFKQAPDKACLDALQFAIERLEGVKATVLSEDFF